MNNQYTHICMNSKCPTNSYAGSTWNPCGIEDEEIVACDYCSEIMYKIEQYVDKNLGYEVVLFENKNWVVTTFSNRLAGGWIVGTTIGNQPIGDLWVYYGDGNFGFDYPYKIPKYIKNRLRVELKKIRKLAEKESK